MFTSVRIAPHHVAFTDRSGTITTGASAQEAAPENLNRRLLFVQNVSDTNLWVNVGAAAVANQPSILLVPNAMLQWGPDVVPTGAVSVIGATTGKAFVCKEA